jgi:flagellar hook assembly protein FlgD
VHIKDVHPTGEYQNYRWNGVRDDGSLAGPGIYTTQVIAANEAGEAQTLDVSMLGKVTRVYFEGGAAQLVVAGQTVSADRVQAVQLMDS